MNDSNRENKTIKSDVAKILIKVEQLDQKANSHDKHLKTHDQRFDKIDQRFDKIDQRFGQMDNRIDQLDYKFDRMECNFSALKEDFHRLGIKFEDFSKKQDLILEIVLSNQARLADMDRVERIVNEHELRITTVEHFIKKHPN